MPEDSGRFDQFSDVLTTMEQIREVVRAPAPPVANKAIDHIDDIARRIIEKSPFVVVASADGSGLPDISPKGDPAGFVRVLGRKYLAIPDRPGNRRLDTFQNLLHNPYLALLFMIPGKGETLRITGECRIVRDAGVREAMQVKGRVPELAVVMHVERVFVHCPKCVVRSSLWKPENWPDASNTASVIDTIIAHANLDMTPAEVHALAEADGARILY